MGLREHLHILRERPSQLPSGLHHFHALRLEAQGQEVDNSEVIMNDTFTKPFINYHFFHLILHLPLKPPFSFKSVIKH